MSDTSDVTPSPADSQASNEMSRATTFESTTSVDNSEEQNDKEEVPTKPPDESTPVTEKAKDDTTEDVAATSVDTAKAPDAANADPLPPSAPYGLLGDPYSPHYLEISDIETKLERELRGSSLIDPIAERRKLSTLRQHQSLSYITLVEDRIKDLEARLAAVESVQSAAPPPLEPPLLDLPLGPPPPPLPIEDTKVEVSAAWLNSEQFCLPTAYPSPRFNIIDVLNEPLGSLPINKDIGLPTFDSSGHHKVLPTDAETGQPSKGPIERLRINSPLLIGAFEAIMDKDIAPAVGKTHVRPFKALLACEPKLRQLLEKTKREVAEGKRSASISEKAKDTHSDGQPEAATEPVSQEEPIPPSASDDKADEKTDSTPTVNRDEELVEHLTFLLDFMDEHLADLLERFRRPRSPKTEESNLKRTFAELWMLYKPGDLIFDPVKFQAYRVLSTSGGRPSYKYKPYEPYKDPFSDPPRGPYDDPGRLHADAPKANIFTQVENSNVISKLCINCFYLDFDGIEVGPVQETIMIDPFEGTKDIKTLPVYPIEYADLKSRLLNINQAVDDPVAPGITKTVLEHLQERGKKFADLPNTSGYSHQNYHGYSLGKVRELIDSDVILDPEIYYQLHPPDDKETHDMRPILGLREPEEGDIRETQQTVLTKCQCWRTNCTLNNELDLRLYDDRNVDRFLISQYVSDEGAPFVKYKQSQAGLKSNHYELFPRTMQGFVLKERTWHTLDIELIYPIENRAQLFRDELILPKKHKEMVESLVRMPSLDSSSVRGVNKAGSPMNIGQDTREDIVRGKGKGKVILLHGEPGVGKTSTAECVAEYTKRPLFALTCGNLGHTAAEVEASLAKNFRLAHRWGCVMLLDEADVFLQERNKMDIKRNAVVSVFLRTLEYYNGILFLTTNKIGFLDEAFKSRIHVSLYYKPLTKRAAIKIWKVNLERMKRMRDIKFEEDEIIEWVEDHIDKIERENEGKKTAARRPWNGRQIHNACQTAAALAALLNKNHLTTDHLDSVAKASEEFDVYLASVHGNVDIAQSSGSRGDEAFKRVMSKKKEEEEEEEEKVKTPKSKAKKPVKKTPVKKKPDPVDDDEEEDNHLEAQVEEEESE